MYARFHPLRRSRADLASGWLAAAVIIGALGFFPATPAISAAAEPARINELVARSLALSPDGRFVAFERRPRGAGGGELYVQDLESRETWLVAGEGGGFARSRRTIWSPNSRRLAFISFEGGPSRLAVWDVAEGRVIARSAALSCPTGLCEFWSPKWLADSRHVLFVAAGDQEPELQLRPGDSAQNDPWRRELDELVGIVPGEDGVTVLRSEARRRQLNMSSDPAEPARTPLAGTRIISLDVETGDGRTLATGMPFIGILVPADARTGVAIVQEPARPEDRERRFSYYRLPLDAAQTSIGERSARRTGERSVSSSGQTLRLLADRVPHWQAGRSVSLSPSGRLLAYVTSGPGATGDLHLVDMASGRATNVTADFNPGPNLLDRRSEAEPSRRRADWHGKFGTGHVAPLWDADERSVYLVRAAERPASELGLRFDLWRVPLSGGNPERVETDTSFSLTRLATCPAMEAPCPVRNEQIIARIRRHGERTDHSAFAAINVRRGEVRILQDLGVAGLPVQIEEYDYYGGTRDLVSTALSEQAIGASEAPDTPPELWLVRSGRDAESTRLAALNPGPVPAVGRMMRVSWLSPDGEPLGGLLQLPVGLAADERPPMIMYVYGGSYISRDDGRFGGGERQFDRLRNEGRFAILSVDMPPPRRPNGPNCDYMAANAIAALDAARETGLVDTDNAGIIGTSWGGYSVNCIITRTDRFKAAASVVGLSNLVSTGVASRGGLSHLANITATPWEAPELYVSETPLFHLDRISTPLLIVYGKRDLVPLNHQTDLFYGLNALNKPVELVGYDESGHYEMFEMLDFWTRLRDWFGPYLRQ